MIKKNWQPAETAETEKEPEIEVGSIDGCGKNSY